MNNESLDHKVNKRIVIVISRYNENLEWLNDDTFKPYPIIIYNKGRNEDFYKPEKLIKIVNVVNVGRCDHTYLYHIINDYDILHDIIIFLPGSTNIYYKMYKTKHLLFYINQQNKAMFLCSKETIDRFLDFQLDFWECTSSENSCIHPENKLKPSSIRPFGKWFKSMFGDFELQSVAWNGIFSISKMDILQHSKEYYKNLIFEVSDSSNPETGHYFERSWEAVFSPMNDTIKIYGY